MKVECVKSDFCTPKPSKKWKKKEELGGKNPVLEQEEMDSLHFF